MAERNYNELTKVNTLKNEHACIGLDVDPERIRLLMAQGIDFGFSAALDDYALASEFNLRIIETTKDHAAAYKPNFAFYLALGPNGLHTLKGTSQDILRLAPNAVNLLDAKFNDIGPTAAKYARFAYDVMGFDAVTLNIYLGSEAMEPFWSRADKGFFGLTKTSNPGAGELQDLDLDALQKRPLFRQAARIVRDRWDQNRNAGIVVGATYPKDAEFIRRDVGPDINILFPGFGKQGGRVEDIIPVALEAGQKGLANQSSDVNFPVEKISDNGKERWVVKGEKRYWDAVEDAARSLRQSIKLAQGVNL